jgi:hypothetical protein
MERSIVVSEVLKEIDAQIARLEQVRDLLSGTTASRKRGRSAKTQASATSKKVRGPMSAETRARMRKAQKARWAKQKAKTSKRS